MNRHQDGPEVEFLLTVTYHQGTERVFTSHVATMRCRPRSVVFAPGNVSRWFPEANR